jgi:4-carboxymuconolactone decarboxylase
VSSDLSKRDFLATGAAGALSLAGFDRAFAQQFPERSKMQITRSGSQPRQGPAEYFTGSVRIDTPFKGSEPARVSGGIVTFEPGARTAWHTHPLGQTLIVTAGTGWVQMEGAPREEIRSGDVVFIPAGTRHWHGATATSAMTHAAVAEALDGKSVDWMEKVSDAQYRTG